MIANQILGIISTSTRKTLFTKRKDFSWLDTQTGEFNYDGPTILHILIVSVNLSKRVGVTRLKEKIRVARMSVFEHNMKSLLANIASNYNLIVEQGFLHDDIIMDTFNALLKSKNVEFNSYIH